MVLDNLNASNLDIMEQIYERYQADPTSIDGSWRSLFDSLDSAETKKVGLSAVELPDDLRVYNLINAYRKYGHLWAKINPIATHETAEPWQLKLETLGFNDADLSRNFPTYGILSEATAPLSKIIEALKNIYCDKIGIEYMGLQNPEMEKWLQERIEPNQFKIQLSIEQKKMILQQLNRSELFETFIQMKYTGQKRFSLEGAETLIPMLEAVVETGHKLGLEEFGLGMAHRGRINVLSNILQKSYADVFSEFEEGYTLNSVEGSGDVKYHKGYSSEVPVNGSKVKIFLAPNPSHLDSVYPVVEGQVFAKQVIKEDDIRHEKVIAVLVHGDAAISGQGVIYETLQFYKLPGYSTGGSLHIVVNNQIGFTTTPEEGRSTFYCTDIAKSFNAPVFHVNAEDPEGCVYVINLAMELRKKFHCDVFIDLNCYRKYGHNESDEPAYTQPLEYLLIRKKRPIREIYRDDLIRQGVLEKGIVESLEKEFTQSLNLAQQESKENIQKKTAGKPSEEICVPPEQAVISTKVSKEILQQVAEQISIVPDGFNINQKLQALVRERLSMVIEGVKPIDWGMAELLAYGSLLWEGYHVRLSGQDSRRGTFSHRHAVWVDQKKEEIYVPLNHLKDKQGRFDVYNSSLSEYAVLGFEYGYSFAYKDALVIWEAQFGDFSNGAQIIIDQYITTSEQKWSQKCPLTLFLPHGYEGQGPEHSSGRMERFLSLAAEENIRVVNPTTPAQFFHLLRKQVLNPIKKPLIVYTPKGLLRFPGCVSQLDELANGEFKDILEDPKDPKIVKRLVLCSGRIYYDLIAEREKAKADDMAIVRIEQLYPLNTEKLADIIQKYSGLQACIWVQEEPRNMGAWDFIHPQLRALLLNKMDPQYIGRPRSASPAVGSYTKHKAQYAEIISKLFGDRIDEK